MDAASFRLAPEWEPLLSRDPHEIVERLQAIYDQQTGWLLERFALYAKGEKLEGRFRVFYPRLRFMAPPMREARPLRAYGYASYPGLYETTVTRPDLYRRYFLQQCAEIIENHDQPIEVGLSDTPLPLLFAAADGLALGDNFDAADMLGLRAHFDLPDLLHIDDRIANGDIDLLPGQPRPMALFTAPRVDYSLQRLRHYCGMDPKHFQEFVLFTNYHDYIADFIERGRASMAAGGCGYESFVSPGGYILHKDGREEGLEAARQPQMPAYHLTRPEGDGVTLVNIGVGPSNAKTITDHIAVLRPSAWLMIGHCAGLRKTQKLGDYVLAHAYMRDDKVLDPDLPAFAPLPALAEIQQALESAVGEAVGKSSEAERKRVMRTGTVASVDNRNWELREQAEPNRRLSQSRAVALDMESATIAANGFRFRVPYGTLLCVSDKPLHGELKLPGMADAFYRRQVRQHLDIGVNAVEKLRQMPPEQVHSRKLRSFDEPLFR